MQINTIIVRSQKDMRKILDYVHDRPFDLSLVSIDETHHFVLIPVRLRAKPNGKGEVNSELKIYGAKGFNIEDHAKIEEGDICKIELTPDDVRIIGSLPVNIFITATNPWVELLVPENAFVA